MCVCVCVLVHFIASLLRQKLGAAGVHYLPFLSFQILVIWLGSVIQSFHWCENSRVSGSRETSLLRNK